MSVYEWRQNELGEYSYVEVKKKVKIPTPVISGAVALLVSAIAIVIFAVLIMPNLRPKTIINQTVTEGASVPIDTETASFVGMSERLSRSIVSIPGQSTGSNFFGQMFTSGGGSGVIVSADGYILTSNMAIDGAEKIKVILADDSEHQAEVVGIDRRNDCAVLKIEKDGLTPLEFADSDSLQSGMSVAAIGRILSDQLGTSLTTGTISGISKGVALRSGQSVNLLQTTAAMEDSTGSVLVNTDGKIVGMVTTMISSGVDGINFAIPSNDLLQVLESLINLGVAHEGIVIGFMGLDSDYGVVVESVSKGSNADKGGIKAGDLIMKADGAPVKSVSEINKLRDSHQKGDTMTFTVYRDGEMIDITITLG